MAGGEFCRMRGFSFWLECGVRWGFLVVVGCVFGFSLGIRAGVWMGGFFRVEV